MQQEFFVYHGELKLKVYSDEHQYQEFQDIFKSDNWKVLIPF